MLEQTNDFTKLERKHELELEFFNTLHKKELRRNEELLNKERANANDEIKRIN